jgi:hypothetical protein
LQSLSSAVGRLATELAAASKYLAENSKTLRESLPYVPRPVIAGVSVRVERHKYD